MRINWRFVISHRPHFARFSPENAPDPPCNRPEERAGLGKFRHSDILRIVASTKFHRVKSALRASDASAPITMLKFGIIQGER
jgi:hypothetical protein